MKIAHGFERFIGIDTEEDTLYFCDEVTANYDISLERVNTKSGLWEMTPRVKAGETYRIRLSNPYPTIKKEAME